jgi:hypothetical protein
MPLCPYEPPSTPDLSLSMSQHILSVFNPTAYCSVRFQESLDPRRTRRTLGAGAGHMHHSTEEGPKNENKSKSAPPQRRAMGQENPLPHTAGWLLGREIVLQYVHSHLLFRIFAQRSRFRLSAVYLVTQ